MDSQTSSNKLPDEGTVGTDVQQVNSGEISLTPELIAQAEKVLEARNAAQQTRLELARQEIDAICQKYGVELVVSQAPASIVLKTS